MVSFSQRMGFETLKKAFQIDSIDDDLRNGLWNMLTIYYWDKIEVDYLSDDEELYLFFKSLWISHFKKPVDTLKDDWGNTYHEIRSYYFKCDWNKVYDLIEFIARFYEDKTTNSNFRKACNSILKKNNSAYRFVNDKITQITSEEEIAEIEDALLKTDPFRPIQIHLKTALQLLSDRKSPNYRNSIKESISAVEALCLRISGDPKAPFGKALKIIENKITLHGALKSAFEKLYGYTSDSNGIRHALLEKSTLEYEDAKFMLVSCSAFINYLIAKSAKAGIKIR